MINSRSDPIKGKNKGKNIFQNIKNPLKCFVSAGFYIVAEEGLELFIKSID